MSTQIKCPHCNTTFEPTEAYKHELEEKVLKEEQERHAKELEQAKIAAKNEEQAQVAKILNEQKDQIIQLKKRADEAETQELKMRKEKRQLEEDKQKFEIEKQRQLDEEREKIKTSAKKEAEDSMSLTLAQERKRNEDAQKQILELQRKLQQGSQQTQGEVLELELENILRKEFPQDIISEVKKGQRGADIVQEVFDKRNRSCGVILWESKNAKWSQQWIATLKENQRQAKAQIAVLVATEPPEKITSFDFQEGIWITTRKMVVPLAMALRFDLIRVTFEKMIHVNKAEKAEILYQYITSIEFKHRVEAIVESFSEMQNTIEAEKRWFNSKWAKQEKQIRRVIDTTIGMRGDLEGMLGAALPPVNFLELPEETQEN